MKGEMILVLVCLIAMVACAPPNAPSATAPQSAAPTITPSSAQGTTRVIAQQGAWVLELELSKDTFYAGEQGEALVTLRNQSAESVSLRQYFLPMGGRSYIGFKLVDENGKPPRPIRGFQLFQ